MTSNKTNTSHSIISNSINKRSLDTDHDNDDEEEEEEEEWVGPMPEIAGKTSQDSNVMQLQQQKKRSKSLFLVSISI